MQRDFDLNIEKILDDWEIYHAIREIIANAIDEMKLTKTKDIEINKDSQGFWHIRDYGRGLTYHHLTQNENKEKINSDLVIGKFGVGLKDALAVLFINGINIIISSKYGSITLKMQEKIGFNDTVTLHAVINDAEDENMVGTDFKLNVPDAEIEKAKKLFLCFNNKKPIDTLEQGEIYHKNGKSNIYVRGVKVAEEENYLFDYNINVLNKNLSKALNRERTNVGRTAYSSIVKQMLLESKSKDIIDALMLEIKKIPKGINSDEVNLVDIQSHAIKEYNAIHSIVMVTASDAYNLSNDDKEKIKESGREIVIVPDKAYDKLDGQEDYTGKEIGTFDTVIREYNKTFKYKFISYNELNNNEKNVFDLKAKVISYYPNKYHRQILISETINTMISGDTLGVYDSSENAIIIKREILQNKVKFCEVLFHELVHSNTGLPDNDRNFENELGKIIGILINEIIK